MFIIYHSFSVLSMVIVYFLCGFIFIFYLLLFSTLKCFIYSLIVNNTLSNIGFFYFHTRLRYPSYL